MDSSEAIEHPTNDVDAEVKKDTNESQQIVKETDSMKQEGGEQHEAEEAEDI